MVRPVRTFSERIATRGGRGDRVRRHHERGSGMGGGISASFRRESRGAPPVDTGDEKIHVPTARASRTEGSRIGSVQGGRGGVSGAGSTGREPEGNAGGGTEGVADPTGEGRRRDTGIARDAGAGKGRQRRERVEGGDEGDGQPPSGDDAVDDGRGPFSLLQRKSEPGRRRHCDHRFGQNQRQVRGGREIRRSDHPGGHRRLLPRNIRRTFEIEIDRDRPGTAEGGISHQAIGTPRPKEEVVSVERVETGRVLFLLLLLLQQQQQHQHEQHQRRRRSGHEQRRRGDAALARGGYAGRASGDGMLHRLRHGTALRLPLRNIRPRTLRLPIAGECAAHQRRRHYAQPIRPLHALGRGGDLLRRDLRLQRSQRHRRRHELLPGRADRSFPRARIGSVRSIDRRTMRRAQRPRYPRGTIRGRSSGGIDTGVRAARIHRGGERFASVGGAPESARSECREGRIAGARIFENVGGGRAGYARTD
mmetsp:Transcript_62107/g.183551  ORF Transcript_62107/g.183551 Transcript_62107/m.183551 type:complete len:478 (+) Transcript_62107:337-1770(+)